jgi:hypothetical protein
MEKCIKTNCAELNKKAEISNKKFTDKVMDLMGDFLKDKNKTEKKKELFKKKINILKNEMFSSKETKELVECEVKKCNKELIETFNMFKNVFESKCKLSDDKSCKKLIIINNTLKKPLTTNSTIKALSVTI